MMFKSRFNITCFKLSPLAIALAVSVLASDTGSAAEPDFAYSSFKGLGYNIAGIPLELPLREALRKYDTKFRFREGKWTDSQRKSPRKQLGNQSIALGAIWDIREEISIRPTPWHSGELLLELKRNIAIEPDPKKPVVSDFKSAISQKYGGWVSTNAGSRKLGWRSQYREDYLIYPVKNSETKNVKCWGPYYAPFSPMVGDQQRVTHYKEMLKQIENGWCDAIMVHYYTRDSASPDRIARYGTRIRDFRLEAHSFIEDYKQRRLATEERQKSTPKGKVKL